MTQTAIFNQVDYRTKEILLAGLITELMRLDAKIENELRETQGEERPYIMDLQMDRKALAGAINELEGMDAA
jgi:hypothetical protein